MAGVVLRAVGRGCGVLLAAVSFLVLGSGVTARARRGLIRLGWLMHLMQSPLPYSLSVHVTGTDRLRESQSTWVWPGTCTGCNGRTSTRIVAFQLAQCHGHRSYNAMEWYFPQYGDTFRRDRYVDTCSPGEAEQVGEQTRAPASCPSSQLAGGGEATEVNIEQMSCEAAAQLIAGAPRGPFTHETRFLTGGFRCGTEGSANLPSIVQCALGDKSVLYPQPLVPTTGRCLQGHRTPGCR